jgi:hypothetical protein
MGSLSFSEYSVNNSKNKQEKRQPTLGKPKTQEKLDKNFESMQNIQNIETSYNFQQNQMIPVNEDSEKQNKMNRILQKISSDLSNDDSTMGNFEPISPPEIIDKSGMQGNMNPQPIKYSNIIQTEDRHSNYNEIYEKPMSYVSTNRKPYYANMGISTNSSEMDKILEKLEYLTHLLEEQKNEKTDNIAEEFVLYTFLGVFVIYIVDSFSRSGKYIR